MRLHAWVHMLLRRIGELTASYISALTNIIFAYGGHVAIFSFASEMRNPADFKYSLALVQTVATVF